MRMREDEEEHANGGSEKMRQTGLMKKSWIKWGYERKREKD